ncbi:MAG: hypothetical protein WKG00_03275 [Polyangiaceae bacterium]
MISRYGAVDIPLAPTASGDFAGDRGLSALLRFAGAVLNAQAATAWDAIAKGQPAVRAAFGHDPKERSFNEKHLPAMWGWRTRGTPNDWAADVRIEEGTISLLWVYAPAQQEHQRIREPFANALAKALDAAVAAGAHPSWIHPLDTALPEAFLTPTLLGAAPLLLEGNDLDGAVGSRRVISPRRVTLTASAVPGAYALDPIAITGETAEGELVTEALTPPDADGGWTLEGTTEVVRILSISVPGQPGAGAIALGHTASERALYDGSSVPQVGGFDRIRVSQWEPSVLVIQVDGAPKPLRYEAVQFTVTTREILERFTDDIAPHLELEGELVHEDGTPQGAFLF